VEPGSAVLEGVPVLIVQDGKPLEEILKIERLTLDEVKGAAREKGISDLSHVRLGVLEPDGKFSFAKKDESTPNRRTDDRGYVSPPHLLLEHGSPERSVGGSAGQTPRGRLGSVMEPKSGSACWPRPVPRDTSQPAAVGAASLT
jgi:uncharacterized protein DUF421